MRLQGGAASGADGRERARRAGGSRGRQGHAASGGESRCDTLPRASVDRERAAQRGPPGGQPFGDAAAGAAADAGGVGVGAARRWWRDVPPQQCPRHLRVMRGRRRQRGRSARHRSGGSRSVLAERSVSEGPIVGGACEDVEGGQRSAVRDRGGRKLGVTIERAFGGRLSLRVRLRGGGESEEGADGAGEDGARVRRAGEAAVAGGGIEEGRMTEGGTGSGTSSGVASCAVAEAEAAEARAAERARRLRRASSQALAGAAAEERSATAAAVAATQLSESTKAGALAARGSALAAYMAEPPASLRRYEEFDGEARVADLIASEAEKVAQRAAARSAEAVARLAALTATMEMRVRAALAATARLRRARGAGLEVTSEEAEAEAAEEAAAAEAAGAAQAADAAAAAARLDTAEAEAQDAWEVEMEELAAAEQEAEEVASGVVAEWDELEEEAGSSSMDCPDGGAEAFGDTAAGMTQEQIAADVERDVEEMRCATAVEQAREEVRRRARAAATGAMQASAPTGNAGAQVAARQAASYAQAAEGQPKPRERVQLRVAHWNTQGLHCGLGATVDERGRYQSASVTAATAGDGHQEMARSCAKMSWLTGQLAAEPVDVMFLYEVRGTRKQWAPLNARLDAAGYCSEFVGEGSANSVVVAARKTHAVLKSVKRLATRVVGAEVQFEADRRRRRLVGMHGLNAETKAADLDASGEPVGPCFAGQVAAARKFVEEGSGGLVGGDMNRVLCAAWRSPSYSLGGDDRRLRKWAGWNCTCCGDSSDCSGTAVSVKCGRRDPTRWGTHKGRLEEATAQIDWCLAVGAEEARWSRRHCLPAYEQRDGGSVRWAVSDHAFMVYESGVLSEKASDVRRPLPPAVGSRGGSAALRAAYMGRTSGAEFGQKVAAEAARSTAAGRAALEGVSAAFVDEVATAAAVVQATTASGRLKAGAPPKQRFNAWAGMLHRILDLRSQGERADGAAAQAALKRSRRLSGLAAKQRGVLEGRDSWSKLLTVARRELDRAGRDSHAQAKTEDERLYEAVKSLEGPKVDALVRMQRVWRALRASRATTALDKVYKDDRAPKAGDPPHASRVIHYDEEEFKEELRNIGERFVLKMADAPAKLPAFRAWCGVFMASYDRLSGVDGGDFVLAKELTWDIFKEVLATMPGNKAVGAGGFTVELLRLAGEEAQLAFYEAMMSDLRGKRVPENWQTVLYALLIKKGNDPGVVAERREIALMAQDMKLLLQMARRVSYQRIVGRVMNAQAGWLSGFGCADTGAIAARILQQQARLKRPLYLLYIDLSTFFPRCDRQVISVAEAVHGLPPEVQELVLLIYGDATQPEKAVTCHYDSAAGLGAGFKNWMGALMGDVLSPDKAKILLNTVIVAIAAVCKGVRLWGYDVEHVERAQRAVAQMAFADDWLGTFASEKDLRRAWGVWRMWEAIAGCKLGAKGKAKTVVSGVRYDDNGKAASVPDPLLRMRDGSLVPFAHHDESYKHVGNARCANGDDRAAWALFLSKIQAALARLRRMRRPSRNEFVMVSNALIGGLAGYYLQTLYITWEQAEEIEREWRAIFRMKFGKSGLEDWSKPRALFYQVQGSARQVRHHVWGVGLAALVANVDACMADVDDTPQRAATRSQIALALERWGCRSSPNRWQWTHLSAALEASLKSARCRQLGDAWMLAVALLTREDDAEFAEREESLSKWARNFSREREGKWGRWVGSVETRDPMHDSAAHWSAPRSTMISEPTTAGGLGLVPEPILLHAGVVCVGHMCQTVVAADGSLTYKWREALSAQRQLLRLPRHGAAAAAWTRQVERLEKLGVRPCAAEACSADGSDGGACRLSGGVEVDDVRIESMLRVLEVPEACARRSQENWERSIRACYSGVQARPAREWAVGGCDRGREARGARYVFAISKDGSVDARGGQARWLARSDGAARAEGDEQGLVVGDDGWLHGHEEATARMLNKLRFDEGGHAVGSDGAPFDAAEVAELPPALQIQARASAALLAKRVPVVDQWPPAKVAKAEAKRGGLAPPAAAGGAAGALSADGSAQARDPTSGPHLNLAVQRRNRRELAKWQARIGATAVYTIDGSRDKHQEPKAEAEYVVSRAAIRHDGAVFKGRMVEPEGADNYLAELAAQLDAASAEDVGGRIIIVFDATGPPIALRKMMRASDRRRQGRYAGSWLDALRRLLDRQEVVVFLWQTSHVGSPINEWADVEASAAIHAPGVLAVPRLECSHASLRLARPRRATREWAAHLAAVLTRRRLQEALKGTQVHDAFDMPALTLADDVQATCDAVLAQRCQFGDERRFVGKMRAMLGGERCCPFGCTTGDGSAAKFTWAHVQFSCEHHEVVAERRAWVDAGDAVIATLKEAGEQVPHSQWEEAMRTARKGLPATRRGAVGTQSALSATQEVSLRRLVGGLVRGTASCDADKAVRRANTTAVTAGAGVQQRALALVSDRERELTELVRRMQLMRRMAQRWLRAVSMGGPRRASELREVHVAAARVAQLAHASLDDVLPSEAPGLERWELSRWAYTPWARELCERVAAGVADVRLRCRRPGNLALEARDDRDRPGGSAYARWRILELAQRWRRRAAERLRRREAVGPTRSSSNKACLFRAVSCAFDGEAARLGAIAIGDWLPGGWDAKMFPIRAAPVRRTAGDSWEHDSLMESEARARGHYLRGGGRRGENERAEERAARAIAQQAARLKRYRAQLVGPQLPGEVGRGVAVTGLSGRWLQPLGAQVHIEVGRRTRRRARGSAPAPASARPASGMRADGKWPFERVLEVRRVQTRLQTTMARIRWVGINPADGLPWRDSWIEAGWGMTPSGRAEVAQLMAAKYGPRQTPARAAPAITPSPAPRPRDAEMDAKWSARWSGLRSRREDEAEESEEELQASALRWRRARRKRRIGAESNEGESDDAAAEEAACSVRQGRSTRHKRHAAVEDEE